MNDTVSRERPVAPRLINFLLASALLLGAHAGCRSLPSASSADRTHGVVVELLTRTPDQSSARYLLEKSGVLSFGGGFDAMNETYTWSGEMTQEEIDQLLAALEAHGWFEDEPADAPGDRTFELWVRRGWNQSHIKVKGDVPGVVAVYDLLETTARRRHEDALRSLPRPGRQPN